MINDTLLTNYLTITTPVELYAVQLPMGNQGENLPNWQVHFNRLSYSEMYLEYQSVVNQLIHAQLDEKTRLALMNSVFKVTSPLFGSLKQTYHNATGFLDEEQQQALDMVLSAYYLAMMFYHSVWQRVAVQPIVEHKKGLASLLGRPSETLNDKIIQKCLHYMMSLLREALYEKYLGYRKDINVIWHYLNACYRLVAVNGWQNYQPSSSSLYAGKTLPKLHQIYSQCLLAHIINPYNCRRPDLIEIRAKSLLWSDQLIVTPEQATRPFLFVNLLGDEPPQLQHVGLNFNPFAKDSDCVFLNVEPLMTRLAQLVAKEPASQDSAAKMAIRNAKIALNNIKTTIEPPTQFEDKQTNCQAVVGFQQIHYMLANRSSLNNLIQAQTLPERLRPRNVTNQQLNKSTTVLLVGTTPTARQLTHTFSYEPATVIHHSQHKRSTEFHAISQLQVQSLIAIRQSDDPTKQWQIGRITKIQQSPMPSADNPKLRRQAPTINLTIEAWVQLFGANVVPCGVRLQNDGSRPAYFMPALIIPKDQTFQREKTSLMMARFGYNVNDKLILRIDAKEVTICLTELLNLTDDVEEYAFARLQ